jgi:hypothetical protein
LTKKKAVSQETLIKTLLKQKQHSIKQGLPVNKKTLLTAAFILALLLSAVAGAFFVKSTQANPYRYEYKTTEVPPPADAKPPVIIIHTPQNGSYYSKNLNLTFDVNIPEANFDKVIRSVSKLYYKASWEPNEISITDEGFVRSTSFSINLSDVRGGRGGNLSLTIYAVGSVIYEVSQKFVTGYTDTILTNYEKFEITGSSTVHFTKDLVSPSISFLSPPNVTYVASDVKLDFTVSEAASEILYCLDGKQNQTITDSLILTGLDEGAHNVTLYAADLAGNAADPKTISFSVDLPESFPVATVITSSTTALVLVGAGLLIYFRKRKR